VVLENANEGAVRHPALTTSTCWETSERAVGSGIATDHNADGRECDRR